MLVRKKRPLVGSSEAFSSPPPSQNAPQPFSFTADGPTLRYVLLKQGNSDENSNRDRRLRRYR